jgi:hypothetical protein
MYISTPSGLSEWFALTSCNSRGEFYTFIWNDSEESKALLKRWVKSKFKWIEW